MPYRKMPRPGPTTFTPGSRHKKRLPGPYLEIKNRLHSESIFYFGGRGGIRTLGSFYTTAVFKTTTLNHSDTLPGLSNLHYSNRYKYYLSRGCRAITATHMCIAPLSFNALDAYFNVDPVVAISSMIKYTFLLSRDFVTLYATFA